MQTSHGLSFLGRIVFVAFLAITTGCATLEVTPKLLPDVSRGPVPARLGVQVEGDKLKKLFADPSQNKLGIAPGQMFKEVVLLPPDTRYSAPQEVLDQFGTDLILQLQVADAKGGGGANIYALFGAIWVPSATSEVTLTLEGNLRDAHSGRLIWSGTESFHVADHFVPAYDMEDRIAGLTMRAYHNAVLKVFERVLPQLADYQPGGVPMMMARRGSVALSQVEKELKAFEEQERQIEEQKQEEQKKLAAIQQQVEQKKRQIEGESKNRVGSSAALSRVEKELTALEEQERQITEQKQEEQKKLAAVQQQLEEKRKRIEEENRRAQEEKKKLARAMAKSVQPITLKANRYALVIGVEQYRERIPRADFAARDAQALAHFLTKSAGYPEENVVVRLNDQASKSDLEKYFEGWIKNHVDASSSLLIYFSGHGTPQTTTGEAYLVPYDGDPGFIEQTGYPLKRLYEILEKLPTKNIVVMLDSCFSGAGARSVLAQGAKPMVLSEGVTNTGTKAIVFSATSGSNISVAYQEKKQGLFTYYALQGLAGEADLNGDGGIEIQELFDYLKPQVQRVARRIYNTEQVPQLIIPLPLLSQPSVRFIELDK